MRVTHHGRQRVNKRLGLPRKLADQLALEARQHGYGQACFKGGFRRYLDKQGILFGTSPIVHKGNVFVFAGETLVTAWPVPQQFRLYAPKEG